MGRTSCMKGLGVTALLVMMSVTNAGAYRLIQNTSVGRTSFGTRVTCTDPIGFAHWTTASIPWRLNLANQGSKPGVSTALQHALDSWTNVSPAGYAPTLVGNTSGGFALDGINSVSWGSDAGCTGGCLALTALVLAAGQVITEADIVFSNAFIWNTNGSDYDVEAIAAHEFGHGLGIHHSDYTKPKNRPSMYSSYFGTAGRSLESDDWGALNCSASRYLVAGSSSALAVTPSKRIDSPALAISSRPRSGGAIIRYTLQVEQRVKLDLYDVAGRKLATLVDDFERAGQYELAWDGSTRSEPARTGVYFARITTPSGNASATVLLMK